MARVEGVVVFEAYHGYAVDFARHRPHPRRFRCRRRSDRYPDRTRKFSAASRLEGHLRELRSPRPRAGWGRTTGAGKRLVPRGHLLVGRVGGQTQLGARALDGGKRETAGGAGMTSLRQLCVREGSLAHVEVGRVQLLHAPARSLQTRPRQWRSRSAFRPLSASVLANAPAPMAVTFCISALAQRRYWQTRCRRFRSRPRPA